MLTTSPNFSFLGAAQLQLARLGALAEWSLPVDPPTPIVKARQFTETLAR